MGSRNRPRPEEFNYRPSNADYRARYGNAQGIKVGPLQDGEKDQRIIMNIAIDVSGSTQELWPEMTSCFNEVMMESFRQTAEMSKKVLRVGAVVFSEKIIPIWEGFEDAKTITSDRRKKLTEDIIRKAHNGTSADTALYRTMIECLRHSATAARILDDDPKYKGNPTKINICVVTDGANNLEPLDAGAVREITDLITDRDQVQLVLAYFATEHGLSHEKFQAMTKMTGFSDNPYYFNVHRGTVEERARAFRHFFNIISRRMSDRLI